MAVEFSLVPEAAADLEEAYALVRAAAAGPWRGLLGVRRGMHRADVSKS